MIAKNIEITIIIFYLKKTVWNNQITKIIFTSAKDCSKNMSCRTRLGSFSLFF